MNKLTGSTAGINTQELIIEGAGCASCVGKIEIALNRLDGVESAEMNFALRTVSVSGDVGADVLSRLLKR